MLKKVCMIFKKRVILFEKTSWSGLYTYRGNVVFYLFIVLILVKGKFVILLLERIEQYL